MKASKKETKTKKKQISLQIKTEQVKGKQYGKVNKKVEMIFSPGRLIVKDGYLLVMRLTPVPVPTSCKAIPTKHNNNLLLK